MLILTRQPGESILIGEDIQVAVLGIDERGNVKLGFVAPREVRIHREEVVTKINAEAPEPAL